MATPTVSFFSASAGTNSALLVDWMTQLQSMLFAKGWTLEYADSDAIGSSVDPSTPAWDKTPATDTDAGIAVYRMPANGHATRWFVRLRPGWAGNTNRPYMRGVQLGTSHDGSGNLSGGGAELVPSATSQQLNNREWLAAVSEDGFAFVSPITSTTGASVALVERARRSDTGEVTDDLLAYASSASNGAAFTLVRAGVGQVHGLRPVAIGGFANGTSPSAGLNGTLQNYDGSYIPILGPFWARGYPFFHGRLAFLVSALDHSAGSDCGLTIDGGPKTYRVANTVQGGNWAYWAVATE